MNILRFTNPATCNRYPSLEWNSLFDELANPGFGTLPSANVVEEDDRYEISLAVPGYSKDQVSIQFKDDVLMVKGTMTETKESNTRFLSREFGQTSFVRRFVVPKTVDSDKISAAFSNGILLIAIPKKEEVKAKEPRQIAIE